MTPEDTALEQVKAILAEHFHSWGVVALTEQGDYFVGATNDFIGESLFSQAAVDYLGCMNDQAFGEDPEEYYEEE